MGRYEPTPILTAPNVTAVTPATIPALVPGTAKNVALRGQGLDLASGVLLDGVPIDASRYTIVSSALILLDMPQSSSLGAHTLGVTDGATTDEFPIEIVAPAEPVYQLGSGEALNVVDRDDGLTLILSGPVGSVQRLLGSLSNLPSANSFLSLEIGNQFTSLIQGGQYVIPASGWLRLDLPAAALPDPGPSGMVLYSQTFRLAFPKPFAVSNLQSIELVQ